jgi:hypothetical protein
MLMQPASENLESCVALSPVSCVYKVPTLRAGSVDAVMRALSHREQMALYSTEVMSHRQGTVNQLGVAQVILPSTLCLDPRKLL